MTISCDRGSAGVTLKGIGVSPGVAAGEVFLLSPRVLPIVVRELKADEIEHEICRLEDALIQTRRQIRSIQKDLEARSTVADASILDAHIMVLDDRVLIEEIVSEIKKSRRNAEAVFSEVAGRYAKMLESLKDEYLRERVSDVRDVVKRVVRNLLGDAAGSTLQKLRDPCVVVAPDLAPSETAGLRREIVVGFAIDQGSMTSHTAVMARALRIPAVVGLHDISRRLSSGDQILLDGNKGVVIINPTPRQVEEYGAVAEARRSIVENLQELRRKPAVTRDGKRIVLSANTEGLEEIDAVREYGAEGVGLFRSEYLLLTRKSMVDEKEQTAAYSRVADALAPEPVIVRTFDLGGDKFTPVDGPRYPESNPFLGCRSIRYSLAHPDTFKAQLRAILRASHKGHNVKLMYPMICKVEEVLDANRLLEEAKQDLRDAGEGFDENIEVGVMIEIPSAALAADTLAPHVNFFSLGTNDLVQYTLAVDRVNDRVAYLYEPTHPAVIRLIKEVIDAGHRHNIWVGLCGEMAGDPLMTPLLLGLGVDELSVSPTSVPLVKDMVRSLDLERARSLADLALTCQSGEEIRQHCRALTQEVAPELLELI